MRKTRGGIAPMAAVVEAELGDRHTGLHTPHLKGLAELAASALACRSVNSAEWMAVMGGFVPEVLAQAGAGGKTAVLMLDQSKVGTGFECLMVSLRRGERAIPVAWRMGATAGASGFDVQKPLLEAVAAMATEGIAILLAADRFYGTAGVLRWCQQQGWQYRIRLRGDLILPHEGGEITTGDAARAGLTALHDARLGAHDTTTHIGILREKGYKEPWIIAMSELPTKGRVLDDGMRWGIEPFFSDMKSRGFGITKPQLRHADRLARLMLILALATYWAVPTAMTPPETLPRPSQKKRSAA